MGITQTEGMNKEESFKGNNDLTNEIALRGDLRFIVEISLPISLQRRKHEK